MKRKMVAIGIIVGIAAGNFFLCLGLGLTLEHPLFPYYLAWCWFSGTGGGAGAVAWLITGEEE